MSPSYRRDYHDDPGLADRVFELLESTFPGISAGRADALAFGTPWESRSTPFVIENAGRVVSHVALMPMAMHLMGRRVVLGGVHAVATDPAMRRQGHFRALLTDLIAWFADRFETLALTTLHPEYFEPFGFTTVPEFVFRASAPPPATRPGGRRLDLARPDDRGLIRRLIRHRAALSPSLAAADDEGCWAFYEYRSAIRYVEAFDAAVIAERHGRVLKVFDVIAPSPPAADALFSALGEPVDEVVTYFDPAALGGDFRAEPHDLGGGPLALEPGSANWRFMVRGPFAPAGRPLMLPRPARC